MCGDACWLGGATGHSPRPETARRGCKMDWDGPAVSPLGGRKSALSAPGRPPLDERTSANSTHPTRLRLRFGHTGAAHYAQRDNVVPSAVAAAREVPADCCSTRTHCVHLGVSMPKFRPEGGRGRRAEQLYVAQLTFGLSRTTTTTSLPRPPVWPMGLVQTVARRVASSVAAPLWGTTAVLDNGMPVTHTLLPNPLTHAFSTGVGSVSEVCLSQFRK